MRRVPGCLLLCLLLCVPALADDGNPTQTSTAKEVLAAWREGATYRLVALARKDDPDPWVVADGLCRLGAQDAALAFARAAVRQDTARLASYLEKRGRREPDAEVRAAIKAADDVGEKAEAEAVLETLEAVLGRGDQYEQTLLEVSRGNVLSKLERPGESAEAFLSAGRLAERLGWLALAARVYRHSGELAYEASNQEAMLTAWTGLLTVQQGRENDKGTAQALMFVGLVHVELGDYQEALRYLKEAEAANEAIGNEDGVAWVLNNLSLVYGRRGEHHREQDALERALVLSRKVGNQFREAAVLTDLGSLYASLHDSQRARSYLDQAVALYREIDYEPGVFQCLGTLGEVCSQDGDYDEAIKHLEPALAYYKKAGDKMFTCGSLNSLGYVYLKKKDLDRALALEEEAVRLGDEITDSWWGAHARQSLADVLIARKEWKAAKRELDKSLRIAGKLHAPSLLSIGHRCLAEMWIGQGKFARAVHEAGLALEHTQAMLSGLALAQAASARGQASHLHDVATRAAVGWGQPSAVFKAMESARSGALLEVLENREDIRQATIPEALRKREREAKLKALAALRLYQGALKTANLRDTRKRRAEMEKARKAVGLVVAKIQREAKSGASVLYPLAATLEQVQADLDPQEAMILYSLIGEEALAFVITRKDAKTHKLGPREAIVAAAGARPEGREADWSNALATLRAKLVAPLGLTKKTRRLLISPDGVLGFVPFALLAPDHEIAYVPSGSAYRVLRQERHQRGRGVLALGDPDYELRTETAPTIAERGGMRLLPLPASRKEAERVGDVVLLGKRATRSTLLKELEARQRWEAVHLACHGLVDPARPMNSALALAFESDGSNLLRCEEVYTQKIKADLTVLSACETGKGTLYRSEGIVGLTQAFMVAGSPRVLVSLWRVDDAATQALMLKFYELWRPKKGQKRLGVAAALKGAQAHVRSQKRWKHPYYWGAWVLWGLPD